MTPLFELTYILTSFRYKKNKDILTDIYKEVVLIKKIL